MRDCYKMSFVTLPPPKASPNNLFAITHSHFVSEAISDLSRTKCVEILDHKPDIVNPLSVSIQPSGKKRLILDLRHVNLYVFKRKFRCEDVSVALQIFPKGFVLFKFDLKSGYHHVEIFPDHRKYLAFSWDFGDGVVKYSQFTVLPFGLSSAPYLFTKLLKPILTSWRCKGIPMAIFLDDGLGGGSNSIKAKINSLTVRADLTRYGFVINEEKSLWEPVQVITWLGTVFDTYQGFISVTERRVSKLKSSIDLLRKDDCKIFKVRDVASVVGQVISLTPCVGSVARIMTRALYTVVNQKQSWNSKVELTKEACDELTFWIDNVDSLNFRCPWLPFQPPARFVYSDASDYACSSFIENEHKIFHQNWSATEGSQSSTWHFPPLLLIFRVKKVEELQSPALSIFHVCASSGISLEMKWIPRDSNHQADSLSRLIDFDDYSIDDDVFHMLDCKWGPHTVDRFACSYNAKLPRFKSRSL